MRLTQVCTYWRKVAISAPSLWNRIHLPSRDAQLLDLHIRRSQNIGLDISIHYSADEALNLQFDAFLSEYIHRARSLYLRLDHTRTLVLPSGLSNSLINLRVDARWTRYDRSPAPLDLRILTTQMPNVRQISLYSVKAGWIIPSILASLTHLVITELPVSHYVDLPDLLDILSQSPNLIELRTGVTASSTYVFTRTGERIFFAKLCRLHLHICTHNPSQYLLLHLKAPVLRELIMGSSVGHLPLISEVLPTTLIDLNVFDAQSAKVTHQNRYLKSFRLYSDTSFESEVFTYTHYVDALGDPFHEIVRVHRLTSIKSLLIHYDPMYSFIRNDPGRAFQYLTTLKNIRSIQIEGLEYAKAESLGSDFFSAVIDMQQRDISILPMLEKLTFRVIAAPSVRLVTASSYRPRAAILSFDKLMDFLSARAKHGKALKELVIHWKAVQYELDPRDTRELASLVGDLRFFE